MSNTTQSLPATNQRIRAASVQLGQRRAAQVFGAAPKRIQPLGARPPKRQGTR